MSSENNNDTERIKELENQLKRTLADYSNLKKRQEKEREELVKFSNETLLVKLINILDGFEILMREFRGLLLEHGLEQVTVEKGDQFDPKIMEALDGNGKTVTKIVAPGYKLHEKVVRPAKVVTAEDNNHE